MLVAACGSPTVSVIEAPGTGGSGDAGVDPNEGAHSGTRLKLTWFNFSDGTRQWNSFYDAERKEDCYPYPPWLDGKTYCTPDSNASVVYTDASCSQKVGQVIAIRRARRRRRRTCSNSTTRRAASGPAHLYLRGARSTVAQYYTRNYDGSCAGPYTSTSYDYYALGGEITTDKLVETT